MFAEIQSPLPPPTDVTRLKPSGLTGRSVTSRAPEPKTALLSSLADSAWAGGDGGGDDSGGGDDGGGGGGGGATSTDDDDTTASVMSRPRLPPAAVRRAAARRLSSSVPRASSSWTRRWSAAICCFMALFSASVFAMRVSSVSTRMRLRSRDRCALSRFLIARRLRL